MTPIALALVLTSALLHAGWSLAIKRSGDPLCFNLLQNVVPWLALALAAPWIPWRAVPGEAWALLALSAPIHALYLYWTSRAYEHGDLSLVYPIARSTPAFLPLFAGPLFGERLHPAGALGIAIVVAGIWLVHARPGIAREAWAAPATRFALLTLAATVGYSLVDKAAMARLADAAWPGPVPRALAYALLLWTSHSLLFAPLVFRARGVAAVRASLRPQLATASAAALVSLIGYALILRALETSLVSYVVAVRQSSVLFAVVLGVLWLRERPGRARVLGAVVTVAGVALIAFFS